MSINSSLILCFSKFCSNIFSIYLFTLNVLIILTVFSPQRKRKGGEGTSTDQVTDAKRMIRQYTADDLINDVIKEVEREKEENDGSQEAGFNDAFAGIL